VSVASKTLRHEIRKLVVGRAIFDVDRSLFDVILDKVEFYIDVLCLRMMRGVLGERDGALVVA
jgi:hypothetical protein